MSDSALDLARIEYVQRNAKNPGTSIIEFIYSTCEDRPTTVRYFYRVIPSEHAECCDIFDEKREYDLFAISKHLRSAKHIATKYCVNMYDVAAAMAAVKLLMET